MLQLLHLHNCMSQTLLRGLASNKDEESIEGTALTLRLPD